VTRLSSSLVRRRALAGAGLAVAILVLLVVIVDPFGGPAAAGRSADNSSKTATQRIERRSLVSQTQVSGTLGYAGNRTVDLPAGTAPSALLQAEQAVTTAQAQLTTAQSSVASDKASLAQAKKTLAADRAKAKTACPGGASMAANCATAKQTVAQDEAALAQAKQKLAADLPQLGPARAGLANAEQALAQARDSATSYGDSSTYTMLPSAGRVIRRGQPLYAIDGQPTLLLYGSTPAWRVFRAGMSPGADVAELNANLRALGLGAPTGDSFTAATAQAIATLQRGHGLSPTGSLLLGSVVFERGPVRVTAVTPSVGAAVQAGPVLSATSTRHDVSIQLDAAQQSQIRVGDHVTVTLPDNSTTPGVVSQVGKVATTPSSSGSDSSTPTIDVEVRLLHPSAAGHLDQAPVDVGITTASVKNVLVVPVNALVALANGGYAVEVVQADGTHRLLRVTTGLFDDAAGLVQVSGAGLAAGLRVVVPAS
jgi:hypothetical protein